MSRLKILIVDDDHSVSTAVKIALDEVYDVTAVHSAKRALQYLSERSADLVVLDINMPGMNGIEALEEIKNKHPYTVVIMLTSCSSAENVEKAATMGAYGFISKPFDLDGLRNYIDTALDVGKKVHVLPAHNTLLH